MQNTVDTFERPKKKQNILAIFFSTFFKTFISFLIFSVSIVGRKDGESVLLKSQSITMDPVAPDFSSRNATVVSLSNNITLRALKPENALQVSLCVQLYQYCALS